MDQNIEEISIREMIEIILKNKKIIVIITLLAMITSAILSYFIITPTYEVKTTLIVKQVNTKSSNSMFNSLLNEQEMSLNTLISAFDNVMTGPRTLEKVRSISPEWENITASGLKSLVNISLVKDTSTVNITVNANSPEDAVALSNIITTRFHDYVTEQNYDLLAASAKSLKRQLSADINLLNEKIRKSEEELATMDKVIVLKKSILEDPYLEAAATTIGKTNAENLSYLSIESEEPNPAYLLLLENITNNKLVLTDLESQYAELERSEGQLKEIAKETGMQASVVHNIETPTKPIKPNKLFNIAIAGMLGFMIAIMYAFFKEYWRNSGQVINRNTNNDSRF